LRATSLSLHVRETFGVDLGLRALYERPRLADQARAIDRALTADASSTVIETTPIASAPTAGPDGAPRRLSFTQERLYFFHELAARDGGHAAMLNMPLAIGLDGPLDVDALSRAVDELIARHHVLRTAYRIVDSRPSQTVQPAPTGALARLDVWPDALDEQLEALAWAPFDLASGEGLRATLLRLDTEQHVLLLVAHHIGFDGWSMAILRRELTVLYEAFAAGRPSPLDPLSAQVADFAEAQRRRLDEATLERLVEPWRERLRGAPPALELPADHPRPPLVTYRGTNRPFALSAASSDAIRTLAADRGASPFMVVLALFQAFLGRLSGERDLVVGSPVAGRRTPAEEASIGCFVNNLVLRADLSDAPSLLTAVDRTRTATLDAQDAQDLPFERLVEALSPARDLSRAPIFQVMLAFQNVPRADLRLGDATTRPVSVPTTAAQVDLTLSIDDHGDGAFSGFWNLAADLFDAETIDGWSRQFETFVEAALAAPETPLADLSILPPALARSLLIEHNATAHDVEPATIQALIGDQVARTPDAVALIAGSRVVDYRTLWRRSGRLARRLVALGVGPDAPPVAVSLDRGIAAVVAILGVLRAGGAYLPLDPAYPADRLTLMLDDSGARVMLVGESTTAATSLTAVRLDAGGRLGDADAATDAHADAELDRRVAIDGEHLAYVIYTSGSTGVPKGVQVPHRSVVNFFVGMDERLGTGPGTWLAVTTISFDISVLELLWTLSRGFEVVLQPTPAITPEDISRHAVTHFQCTPSMAQMLAADPAVLAAMRPLQRLMLGGEAMPTDLAERLVPAITGELHNMYGPTETTIWSTTAHLDTSEVHLGTPITNTEIYIVDSRFQPVPPGVVGELLIGGRGVVRGYRGRAALTADRFVPDPFSGRPGDRLYRTGDLVRRHRDGRLLFAGRVDHQVKIRGHRIELGEIEAALAAAPEIDEAVAVARDGAYGDKRLVGYVTAAGSADGTSGGATAIDPEAHRARLAERLPEAMVPAVIVVLDALPQTPNGKVDRNALPEPEIVRSATSEFVVPDKGLEAPIAELWRELLGIDRVGARDNFFELGGTSLMLVELRGRLHETLDRE
ncbi:MAG: amino acid adenylation domain-containing protein, partial [Acidobacteriota bacterium]